MFNQANKPFFLDSFNWDRLIEKMMHQANASAFDMDPDHTPFTFDESKEAVAHTVFEFLMGMQEDASFPTSAIVEEIKCQIEKERERKAES